MVGFLLINLFLPMTVGFAVSSWLSARTIKRAKALGYFRGRSEMAMTLAEAAARGMNLLEWATAEMERDHSVHLAAMSPRVRKQYLRDHARMNPSEPSEWDGK